MTNPKSSYPTSEMRKLRHRKLARSLQLEIGRAGFGTKAFWLPGRCAVHSASADAHRVPTWCSPPLARQTRGPPMHREAWSVEKAVRVTVPAMWPLCWPAPAVPSSTCLPAVPAALGSRPATLAWAMRLLTFPAGGEGWDPPCWSMGTQVTKIQSLQTHSSPSSQGD